MFVSAIQIFQFVFFLCSICTLVYLLLSKLGHLNASRLKQRTSDGITHQMLTCNLFNSVFIFFFSWTEQFLHSLQGLMTKFESQLRILRVYIDALLQNTYFNTSCVMFRLVSKILKQHCAVFKYLLSSMRLSLISSSFVLGVLVVMHFGNSFLDLNTGPSG